jgi:hypothetical protein
MIVATKVARPLDESRMLFENLEIHEQRHGL